MDRFKRDFYVLTGEDLKPKNTYKLLTQMRLRFCLAGRLGTLCNPVLKKLSNQLLKHYEKYYGLELKFDNIGGVLLMHPYDITVNSNAELGENVTLFKGATIGSIRSGNRKGSPKIGNRVVVGLNATVVGNISIGDNVFIAPNAFVNFDVPDNSVVIGNPGIIKHKENAAVDYLSGK